MSQNQQLKISGLYTSVNELSSVPQGALSEATNIEITQPGVAQPRRGFSRTGSVGTGKFIDALVEFRNTVIAHRSSSSLTTATSFEQADDGTSFGTVTAPTGRRLQFAESNSNLYVTNTDAGPKALENVGSADLRESGAPAGLDMLASTSASAGSFGWSNGDQCAWRHVWKYKDSNGNLLLGPPSQREVFTCTDNTKGIDLVVTIPYNITTSWVCQLYRSLPITAAALAAGGTPSDEMYLSREVVPNSTDITNGYLTIYDYTPDAGLGATIYTAASQEGLAAGNQRPPYCEDLAVANGCLFFGRALSTVDRLLTLVDIGTSSSGMVADDTVQVGGTTYTAKASETIASQQFKVTGSTPTASNIEATARSLVRVINRQTPGASSGIYAYYLSGDASSPGAILLRPRTTYAAEFTVLPSRILSFKEQDYENGYLRSSIDSSKSLLAYSKPQQPEHVPITNYVRVGAKNDPILKIASLDAGLLIFKQGGEVWKLTGDYPNFTLDRLPEVVKLRSIRSCAVLKDKVFCLTDRGVEAVDLLGSTVVSDPIHNELLELLRGSSLDSSNDYTFGLAMESESKYYIFLPTTLSETYPTQAFVLNLRTGAWVKHSLSASCGVVTRANVLTLGNGTDGYTRQENRNYTFTDYADYNGDSVTLSAISGTSLTVAASIDLISVGDILIQGSLFTTVTAVSPATSTVTISSDPGFSTTTTYIYKGIPVSMKWVPETFGTPGTGKQFSSVSLLFKTDILGNGNVTFSTDLSQSTESVAVVGRGLSQWGLFAWGNDPWGGEPVRRPLRQWVPRAKQRGSLLEIGFTHTWAYSDWSLMGVTVVGEFGSEAVSRG